MGIPVYTGGRVPCGVTAHGNPTGPLQFDRLEVAPAARCTLRTPGNVGKVTSPPCAHRAFSPCLRLRGNAILPDLDFLSGTPSRSILSNSSVSCLVLRICRSTAPRIRPSTAATSRSSGVSGELKSSPESRSGLPELPQCVPAEFRVNFSTPKACRLPAHPGSVSHLLPPCPP